MTRRQFLARLGVVAVAGAMPWRVPHAPDAFTARYIHPASRHVAEQIDADAAFIVGDVISIAGIYAINPVTRRSTGHLQQFVVVSENGDLSPARR